MQGTAVLMYHGVVEEAAGSGADPHYAVTPATFRAHLQALHQQGFEPASVAQLLDWPVPERHRAVAVTFDDGHASHYHAAWPLLAEQHARADFFVNPADVGRPGFVTWTQLREMAAAGQSIQSHSYSHRYLDELPEAELREELSRSRQVIEDRLGQPVRLLAPPGGRLTQRARELAAEVGYEAICSSRPGCWRSVPGDIPRFAVLHSTSLGQLARWAAGAPLEMLRQRGRYGLTYGAKRLLGNRAYDAVRGNLLRLRDAGRT